MPTVEGLTLTYALSALPPGRFPFHRWRWELWHGSHMVAAGWRTSPAAAKRALHKHASEFAQRLTAVPLQLVPRAGTPLTALT